MTVGFPFEERAGFFERELAEKGCSCFSRDSVQHRFGLQLRRRPATTPLEATLKQNLIQSLKDDVNDIIFLLKGYH